MSKDELFLRGCLYSRSIVAFVGNVCMHMQYGLSISFSRLSTCVYFFYAPSSPQGSPSSPPFPLRATGVICGGQMWKMREKETEAQREIIKPIVGLSRRGLRTDGEGAFGRRSSRVFYTLQLSLSLRVCVYFSFFSLSPLKIETMTPLEEARP